MLEKQGKEKGDRLQDVAKLRPLKVGESTGLGMRFDIQRALTDQLNGLGDLGPELDLEGSRLKDLIKCTDPANFTFDPSSDANLLQFGHDEDSEEALEEYRFKGYLPLFLGQILKERYVIASKAGWTETSTSWLAKDCLYGVYVHIRVFKSRKRHFKDLLTQVELHQRIQKRLSGREWTLFRDSCEPNAHMHGNYSPVSKLLNAFVFQNQYGDYPCIVYEATGLSLKQVIQTYYPTGVEGINRSSRTRPRSH